MGAFVPEPVPTSEIPMPLTPDAAEAIRAAADAGLKALPRRGAEIGGLLTTSRDDSAALADSIELVPCEYLYGPSYKLSTTDVVRFHQIASRVTSAPGRRIVGYFRSCTGERFDCSSDDVELVRDHLPVCRLMILVKPFSDGHSRMRAFEWNAEGGWAQTAEFDVYRSVGPQPVPDPPKAPAHPSTAAPAAAPPAVREPARFRPWMLTAVVGLFLLAAAAGIVLRYARTLSTPSPPELGLRVEVQGSSLRLTWNHQAHSIQNAKDGVLRINDGSQHREAYLDAAQLRTGSILYRPCSDDVVFRLEIQSNAGAPSNESVRVLDGLRSVSAAEVTVDAPRPGPDPVPARTLKPAVPTTPASPPPGFAERTAAQIPAGRGTPAPREFVPPPKPANSRSEPAANVPLNPPSLDIREPQRDPLRIVATLPAGPPPAKPAPQEAAPPPQREQPDLSTAAIPVVVPPRPVRQVIPSARPFGLLNREPIRVQVQVKIDEAGRVREAVLLNDGSRVSQILAGEALAAAKQWTFEPATINGLAVRSTHTIEFHFGPQGH